MLEPRIVEPLRVFRAHQYFTLYAGPPGSAANTNRRDSHPVTVSLFPTPDLRIRTRYSTADKMRFRQSMARHFGDSVSTNTFSTLVEEAVEMLAWHG